MRTDVDDHVEVAGRTTNRAVLAFAVQAEPLTVIDPRRNPNRHAPIAGDAPGAAAGWAGIADDLAGRAALAARPGDDEEALLEAQLAGAAALRAGLS